MLIEEKMRRRKQVGESTDDADGQPKKHINNESLSNDHQSRPAALPLLALLGFTILSVAHVVHIIGFTPRPLDVDAEASKFSEGRAFAHIHELSEVIGWRQVSTPGIFKAESYLYEQALAIQQLARGGNSQVNVEVDVERFSGGVNMDFFGKRIVNAFRNLSAVSWYVEPHAAAKNNDTVILVMTHFDSPCGSSGAADDVSNVAVMLEAARALVAGSVQLPCPVLFTANGGEETFSQAAYGFMQKSRWRNRIAAFINLEATGSGGYPILFQGSSPWTLRAYLRSAGLNRGSSIAEDIFVANLIPADTDYRMLSFRSYGKLPGIDVAFLLDAAGYHTDRDTISRLRPGVVQEMGEKLLGLLPSFATELQAVRGTDEYISHERAVFFGTGFGFHMLTYSWSRAVILHSAPAALALLLPLLQAWVYAREQRILALATAAFQMLKLLAASIGTCCAVVFASAATGGLRAVLSGSPMIWFSHPAAAWWIHAPVSVAVLLALQGTPAPPQAARPGALLHLKQQLLGAALMHGAISWLLISAGAGSSFLFALWAWTALALWGLAPAIGQHILIVLVLLTPATLTTYSNLVPVVMYFLGKVSMSASLPGLIGLMTADIAIGILIGVLVYLNAHLCLPFVRTSFPFCHYKAAATLLGVSLAACVACSCLFPIYNVEHPKRIMLQHLHRQTGEDTYESFWTVGAMDPVGPSRVRIAPPPSIDAAALGFVDGRLQPRPRHWRDYETFTPIDHMLQWSTFAAPNASAAYRDDEASADLATPPRLVLRSLEQRPAADGGGPPQDVYHLELVYLRPSWAALKLTAFVLGCSLADANVLLPSNKPPPGQPPTYMARLASNDYSGRWRFWVAVQQGGSLELNMSHAFLMPSKAVSDMALAFPKYAHVLHFTVHQSSNLFTNTTITDISL